MPKQQRVEFIIPQISSMFSIADFEKDWLENFILSNVNDPLELNEHKIHYALQYQSNTADEESIETNHFDGALKYSKLYSVKLNAGHLEPLRIETSFVNPFPYRFIEAMGVCRKKSDYFNKQFDENKFADVHIGIAVFEDTLTQIMTNREIKSQYVILTVQQADQPDNIYYSGVTVSKNRLDEIIQCIEDFLDIQSAD